MWESTEEAVYACDSRRSKSPLGGEQRPATLSAFPPEGTSAPPLHRVDAPRHAARARRPRRDRPAGLPGLRVAAPAQRRRREGLVPLPAPLRRRPLGAADRGRRTPPRAGGGGGRRARRRWLARDPGRPERLRRPLRRRHGLHRPGARPVHRRCLPRDRGRDGRRDRRQPHPAPARRPHPGPAGRAVRRPRRGRFRALQRRAPREHRPTSPARSGSRNGPA